MIQFYETYRGNIIVSPLVTQLSWTNNLLILQGTKTIEEKEFYIRLCIKNNYSKRELQRQIQSHYYERYLLSNGNALESLEPVVGEEDCPEYKNTGSIFFRRIRGQPPNRWLSFCLTLRVI